MMGWLFDSMQGGGNGGEGENRRMMLAQQLFGDDEKARTAMKAIGLSIAPLMFGLSIARAYKHGNGTPWFADKENRQQFRDWRQSRPQTQGMPREERREAYQQWRDQRPAFLPDFRPFWDKK